MTDFSRLLETAGSDHHAAAELFALVYDELRRLAAHQLAHEKPGHTLQPTALVHEAYLRLLAASGAGEGEHPRGFKGRGHFFAAAAEAMRRILIESARRKKRAKHGGGHGRQALNPDQVAIPELSDDLLALDEALTKFATIEPVIASLVNLRYFGGLTLKEAASTLGIPPRTADSYWAYARAWLLAEIKKGSDTIG
jgi:RNA polymerase sigma factor (TIGR02999 family)